MNKIMLIGNLGKAPEKVTDNLYKSSIAINESFKDSNGEWQTRTTWFTLVFFKNMTERAQRLTKGQMIFVEGKIVFSEHKEKIYTEVVVKDIKQLSKAEKQEPQEDSYQNYR